MNCEERIRELEQEIHELKDAWEADVEEREQRIRELEENCRKLRDEALDRIRELEEELNRIKAVYEIAQTILQDELGHLETLIARNDWEHAVQHIAHIRKMFHTAIAMHALQNQNTA